MSQQHYQIAGVDVISLREKYQTPLYVMDQAKIEAQCALFKQAFKHPKVETEIIYASKAFLTLAMARLIQEQGLSLDVVSGGELYTAMKAKFPAKDIYFHGNNKSNDELSQALHYNVGHVVLDNPDEFKRLSQLIKPSESIDVLIRINPGIEAHTHEYIKTTKHSSKFGMSIFSHEVIDLIEDIKKHPNIHFKGFHSHIGSQIFESEAFKASAQVVLSYIKEVYEKTGVLAEIMNMGGGFAVTYTKDDRPINLEIFFPELLSFIHETSTSLGMKTPKIMIEPGRAIVAEAGYTLYTVQHVKHTYGGQSYIFVDGSMADHIRTALYQATYDAFIPNKIEDKDKQLFTVTGKACESGDIIIKEILLPTPDPEDMLIVKSTGAYHYSMSSNYNRLLKPAVVFVKNGQSKLIVKRESYDDLIRNDIL